MSFNFLATSRAVLNPFYLMIVSLSLAVRLTVIFASDSEPEMPARPPLPEGEDEAPYFEDDICYMKAPPVGSEA